MPESKHYSFSLALCAGLFSLGVQADLAVLEESELSDVTGAGSGFGFVLRDISLDSGNKNDSNAGRLTVNLGSNKAGDQNNLLMLSELKWKKAGTNEGFNIGTVDDPLVLGDVEEDSRGDYLVFRIPNSADAIDASYRLSYNAYDGFSDTITTSNINDYRISANAMRLIDSYAELWSVPGKGPAMASTINLVADSLVIDGDADSSSNATSINGVEIKNMKLGEKDQPLYVDSPEQVRIEMKSWDWGSAGTDAFLWITDDNGNILACAGNQGGCYKNSSAGSVGISENLSDGGQGYNWQTGSGNGQDEYVVLTLGPPDFEPSQPVLGLQVQGSFQTTGSIYMIPR
ncbi:hypothetical protein ElyMa_001634400 [Elysia marginata]|uniref:Uncharacterized protein n=1 Tax=Elysia marginata TaxID=1093978 RepID=A0AAV4JLL2_9GAST|nr:hypothetical protein ElyMa_001634400 [Elysia marginata]